ncbi:MAG: GNAT family N-acetyltransferase [Candidatus Marinimicrobia bacterium]|jgi:predicted GNAT family N-acyltransferase|nr:GNAT family N-acetyltransferase [Candidatus Neomarinimicrobiota bacterium]MBT4155833.1 GNAT family N-acetyltransferase [Candidatus Neomarinimicrobiota bacterium]MBT4555778.1 GNAT family N-acetyltransferase [Candidatus Neomarinimicrobiota bacterium]MBT4753206.1 GNAT family N-acetyltransferase [Candidatus Neomarinimicrobiota bacterium]MBT5116216.1 GNAT family N-acetyltransferase [Candidatus Neomarinimicrobiota bacterium]
MNFDIKIIETSEEAQWCLFIRRQVFIIGQNIPESIEMDDHKIDAIYYLATLAGKPVGTARYRKSSDGIKLERFAVLESARKLGVGSALVDFVLKDLKDEKTIYLNAQESVITFYKKLGFDSVGNIFYEAEIPHQKMVYSG